METPYGKEKILGERLRRRRFELRERQNVIAARAGTDSKTLSKLEHGDYTFVNPELLPRLADALKTTTDYLLGRSDEPDRPKSPPRAALVGA